MFSEIKDIRIKKLKRKLRNGFNIVNTYLYIYYKNGKIDKFLVSDDNLDKLFDIIATIMLGW